MIRLEAIDEATIEIRPEARLGDSWGPYQAAIKAAGARNRKDDRGIWQTTAPIERAPEIEAAIRHLGLTVSIGPGLATCRDQNEDSSEGLADRQAFLSALEEDSGIKLFGYQREGIEFLSGRSRALLLDEMGLGKTIQALGALPEGAAAIVVCPASLKAVWQREAARFRPELDVTVFEGRGSFRWPRPGEIVVCNFEILPLTPARHSQLIVQAEEKERQTGEKARRPDPRQVITASCPREIILIADEGQAFKSFKADRTIRFRDLGKMVRTAGGRTWICTGTPLTNRPPDLWGVLQAAGLAEATFGSWAFFAECFGGSQQYVTATQKVWVWGSPRSEEVAGRLRAISLRRHKADVLKDLPPKRYEVLTEVELGAKDRKALDKVWAEIEAAGLGEDEDGHKKLPAFEGMSEARAIIAKAKLPLLEAIVESHEDAGDPLVVFSAHKAPVEAIGKRPGWGLLTGDVSAAERTALVAAFQRGELLGLACTIQAAGVGLTMTAASHVVFVDLSWTPAENGQAEDRLHRIGQDRSVLVTTLAIDHPLEKRILALCAWKKGIFESTVGASASYRAKVETAEETKTRAAERALKKPRPPESTAELWAAAALSTLSGMDPDGAREKNESGWNRIDGAFGHRLAAQLAAGLSEAQWKAAIRMCKKYHRQVGRCPEDEPTSDFANDEGGWG